MIYNHFSDMPEVPEWPDGQEEKNACHEGSLHAVVSCAAIIAGFLAALLLCCLLGSCKMQERVVYQDRHHYHTDTLIQTVRQYDSIYFSDSIYISDFVRSDTVWRTTDRWHIRYRDRWLHDTVRQAKTDTVQYVLTQTITKDVEKPLTAWQTFRLWLANILLCVVAASVILFVFRRHIKRLTAR